MTGDDKGRVGTMRDWTRDTGMQLGMRSHTPSIWTGAKLGETSPHCVGRARTWLGTTLRDRDEIRETTK